MVGLSDNAWSDLELAGPEPKANFSNVPRSSSKAVGAGGVSVSGIR
jgi:hypothetical protein